MSFERSIKKFLLYTDSRELKEKQIVKLKNVHGILMKNLRTVCQKEKCNSHQNGFLHFLLSKKTILNEF